jgi:hypothetical protein
MADKILVEVEGIDPFECDEDLYNIGMMIAELMRDAIGDTKPVVNADLSGLAKTIKGELQKMQKPRILKSSVTVKRDWRGVLEGFDMTHHYADGSEETVTH